MRQTLPVIALFLVAGCLPAIGQEGIATKSLRVRSNRAVKKEEVAAIPKGGDLFLYMGKRYCQKYAQSTGAVPRHHGSIDLAAGYEEIITAVMCHQGYSSYGGDLGSKFARIHMAADDRRLNHLDGAIVMVLCTGEQACAGPIATGQLAWYAENIDRAAVRDAVENVVIAPEMRKAFLRRADAASQLILYRAERLDPRRKALYRDLPRKVRADRATHWNRHAALWKRFDDLSAKSKAAIAAKKADRALIAEVSVLRDDYFRACVEAGATRDDCLHGQLARPLTEELVKLAIAAGDAVLARTENAVLQSGKDVSTLAAAMYKAQYAAMAEERKQYDKMRRAQRDGVDEATLRNTFGDPPPINIDAASAWRPRGQTTNYVSLIHEIGKTQLVRGIVKRVARRSKRAVISFEGSKDSVSVPRWDARGVEKGFEIVAVVGESREGYVVVVKNGRALVGIRMFR